MKKRQYSKIMITAVLIFTMVCVVWSFVLVSFGLPGNEVVVNVVVTVFGALAVGYLTKSAVEHNSVNKYGVDPVSFLPLSKEPPAPAEGVDGNGYDNEITT